MWNSAFGRVMIGVGGSNYEDAETDYAALDPAEQTAWQAAATTAIAGLVDIPITGGTISAGFMLFLAEGSLAELGYNGTFDPTTPFPIVAG